MRFWGKILGTQKDYYIVEAPTAPQTEQQEEITEPHEPRDTGVNKKIFWVSTDCRLKLTVVSEPTNWTELPLLLPKHIIQARKIRYTFTGNLENPINTSPVFPGKEKHYVETGLMLAQSSDSQN